MSATELHPFPWSGIDPAAWLRPWQAVWRGAPDNLVQPILPGWTFNINGINSSSPQTEARIVARHSYGRQIGRMAEALEALVVEKYGTDPDDERLADFLAMKREIDQVKQDAAAGRLAQISRDLALLKLRDEAEYERLRDALRDALR
jgi:hypothetical protein